MRQPGGKAGVLIGFILITCILLFVGSTTLLMKKDVSALKELARVEESQAKRILGKNQSNFWRKVQANFFSIEKAFQFREKEKEILEKESIKNKEIEGKVDEVINKGLSALPYKFLKEIWGEKIFRKAEWSCYIGSIRFTILEVTCPVWIVLFALGLLEGLLRRKKIFLAGAFYSPTMFHLTRGLALFLIIVLTVGYVLAPIMVPVFLLLYGLAFVIGAGIYGVVGNVPMKM